MSLIEKTKKALKRKYMFIKLDIIRNLLKHSVLSRIFIGFIDSIKNKTDVNNTHL